MGKLTNKVALVTGASKGIGAGIAKGLAAEGASVVVNYASSKEGLNTTLEALTYGVPMVAIPITNDQPGVAARIAHSEPVGLYLSNSCRWKR